MITNNYGNNMPSIEKVAIQESMEIKGSWYLIKYCKHLSLAWSWTWTVVWMKENSDDTTSIPNTLWKE